jgi:alkylated DNA repair dioxygenase AlkB
MCLKMIYPWFMMSAFQGSLLDLSDEVVPGPLGSSVRRTVLAHGAWVDLRPGWISGAGALLDRLAGATAWRAEKRQMYDRLVDVPRLVCFYGEGKAELGEPFVTAGLCFYRDGRDSVAWHGDTIGRGAITDTMVAIVSIGTPRALLLRPRGGGPALRYEVGHGDLLVMGGSCQRTWQHAIPKTARPAGPRISVQFRPRGVR